jgi:thioredoxin-related protein
MKKFIISLIILLASSTLFAQSATDTIAPAYIRIPSVPPFNITIAPDSVSFTKENLKKKKATIIMVFSPDCDHCVHSTQDLITKYESFKSVQIILATAAPFEQVKNFYSSLKIGDYPNIKVGQDKSFFLGTFFEVRSFPAIFLYDKKGKFKQAFDSNAKWETIAKFL